MTEYEIAKDIVALQTQIDELKARFQYLYDELKGGGVLKEEKSGS